MIIRVSFEELWMWRLLSSGKWCNVLL